MSELARNPPPVSATEQLAPNTAIQRHDTLAIASDNVFDIGDALCDDGIARANWAIPWSDLMMIMFVLFAALLAVHATHSRRQQLELQREKTPEVQQQVVEKEKPIKDERPSRGPSSEPLMQVDLLASSRDAVREANLQNAEVMVLDDQSIKVSIQGPMFFATGKADLRPEVEKFLDRLAQVIKQTPYDVHIVGHTDDQPINTIAFPSNWELSLVRASRVARYLIKAGNLVPSRFVVMGRGEYDPAAANADGQSRALNRRVEIIITRDMATEKEETRP